MEEATITLLQTAANEIRILRNRNEFMAARLDMFDAVMSALHGQPAREQSGAMHPDTLYDIEKHLRTCTNKKSDRSASQAE